MHGGLSDVLPSTWLAMITASSAKHSSVSKDDFSALVLSPASFPPHLLSMHDCWPACMQCLEYGQNALNIFAHSSSCSCSRTKHSFTLGYCYIGMVGILTHLCPWMSHVHHHAFSPTKATNSTSLAFWWSNQSFLTLYIICITSLYLSTHALLFVSVTSIKTV